MRTHSAVLGFLLLGCLAGCASLEESPDGAALLNDDDVYAYMAIGGVT